MNIDPKTVQAFDDNWSLGSGEADRFAEAASAAERSFREFFSIFPSASVRDGEGFELGCGSVLKKDALDRFGTGLEQRFTRAGSKP